MKKLILTFLLIALLPGFAYTLELNSLELCMDKDFIQKISGDEEKKIDELKCQITIQEDQIININDFNSLYAVASVSNLEEKAHERLEIHWVFLQDERVREANTFKLTNTYYSKDFGLLQDDSNPKYVQLEKQYEDAYLGWIVSVVRMFTQPHQNFRTYSSKNFDKQLHVGSWRLTVIDKKTKDGKDRTLYEKQFTVDSF